MFNNTTPKIKRQEPVFKTPMSFSPRVVGNKVVPSPSRDEIWRKQLGLDDDPGGHDSSGSESEEENVFGKSGKENLSMVEYRSLQKELQARNVQRDELLFQLKTLTDKNKQYKSKLVKEEATKKQQMKILRKTLETQLQEKENLLSNVQSLVEEQECQILQLQQQTNGNNKNNNTTFSIEGGSATVKLIEEIKRLQSEKIDLTAKVQQYQPLQKENEDLRKELENLQNCDQSDLGPCPTYSEKQVEKLSLENTRLKEELEKLKECKDEDRNLQDEINELRLTRSKSANLSKLSTQQIQQLEEEIRRLKKRITDLETDISNKKKDIAEVKLKHREEVSNLTNEHQQASRRIRELQAEVTSLQAKEPEVLTKIKKVQVEVESEELKNSYTACKIDKEKLQTELRRVKNEYSQCESQKSACKIDKEKLQTELERVKNEYSQCESQKSALQNEVHTTQKSYSVCRAEKEALTIKLMGLRKEYAELTEQLSDVQNQKDQVSVELCNLKEEKKQLEEQMQEERIAAEKDKKEAVMAAKQEMRDSFAELQKKYDCICHKISLIEPLYSELIEAYILVEKQAKQFPKLIKEAVSQVRKQTCKAITDIHKYNKELLRKYHTEMQLRKKYHNELVELKGRSENTEMQLRKKYHNELVELKGNIRVFCRVRPNISEDGGGPLSETVVDYDRDDDCVLYVQAKGRTQTFEMDKVFNQSSTQTEVFDEVRALVTSCIDGYNVCIFAYGQTGAGKTFTMEGTVEQPGINQRALQELFQETTDKGVDWSYTITVSVIEIYNEMIRDLLNDDTTNKLEVKMNPDGSGLYVPGLSYVEVGTVDDVNEVFTIGQKNRATATTNMNEHSSRSHALLCITVSGVNKTTSLRTTGKLNLVDLAGSERVSKSGSDGTRLKEAQSINKSLSCLGDVIHALRSKQNHVPYRNSKLTYLLQDSLGGDSKTLMIVQIAPVKKNADETVCSLNFAQRVRMVELGQASRRVENGDEGDSVFPGTPKIGTPSRGYETPNSSSVVTRSMGTPMGTNVTPLKGTPKTNLGSPALTMSMKNLSTPSGATLPMHRTASGTPLGSSTPTKSNTPNNKSTPGSKLGRKK